MRPLCGHLGGVSRRCAAFTLVEAVLSLVVVGVMLVAALNTVGVSRLSQFKTSLQGRGRLLAESLVAEIVRYPYEDPNGPVVFGRESGEPASPRTAFDDVDDYHQWSASPPVNRDGTPITGMTGWAEGVTVEWVNPQNVTETRQTETGAKRITVTVTYQGVPVVSLMAIRTDCDSMEPGL